MFENPDGSRTAQVSQTPVNYRSSNGDWLPVDATLVDGPGGRLRPSAHGLAISMARSARDSALVQVGTDPATSVSFGLDGAGDVKASVKGARAVFAGVQSGVDLVEQPTGEGVKELLVLSGPNAPTQWTFPLTLKGLTAKAAKDGSIDLVNHTGQAALRIPRGVMWDSHALPDGGPVTSDAVTYQLVPRAGGGTALHVSIDPAWLTAKDRVFPVTVDPSVTATLSSSGYYETNKVNGSSAELRIGTWDSGATHRARSYLAFANFGAQFANQRVTAASLKLFNIWSGSTTVSTSFTASQVKAAWTAASLAEPGPALGSAVGTWSGVAPAATRVGTSYSATSGAWETANFTGTGLSVLNGWIYGTTANYGLAITASETDNNYWKIFDSGSVSGYQPTLSVTYSPDIAPQVDSQYPPNNYSVQTLTPELLGYGHDADAFPNANVTYTFRVSNAAGTVIATSPAVTTGRWVVPTGTLSWGQTYTWTVTTSDGKLTSLNPRSFALTASVPQPLLTSELSQNTGGSGFEPSAGNYTNTDTDLDVATVGPALKVDRSYNSNDPRTTGAFGTGWSSVYDARATTRTDTAGNEVAVVVTYPDGHEVGFGRNSDGTYSAAAGRYTQVTSLGAGLGYKLVDKGDTTFTFSKALGGGAYGIAAITDASGRAETFTYDASNRLAKATGASGRSLSFTWAVPAGAVNAHVQTVASDPLASGPVVWTYSYVGDQLSSVCPPTSSTMCTKYGTTTSTLYPQSMLGMGPSSYWRLSDAAGAARATSAILANAGTDDATYSGVTLGGASSLPGSTATTAGFNGTSSNVKLLNRLALGASYQSLGMRFRADGANGVLFSYQMAALSAGSTTYDYTPAIYVGSDGRLMAQFWNGAATPMASPASVVDGKWHDVVLAGAGNTQTLYLDGAKVATLSGQIDLYAGTSTQNVYVGAGFLGGGWPDNANSGKSPSPASYFKGAVSDVVFFDRALTGTEVSTQEARTTAANVLTSITRASGTTYASITYDTAKGRVAKVVDQHGGTWTLNPQTAQGSSQVFASSVLGAAPQNYWRFGDASGPDTLNEVNGDQLTFVNGVTVATAGRFSDATTATFDGTSGYADFVRDPAVPNDALIVDGGNQSVGLWFKTSTPLGVLASYTVDDLSSPSSSGYVPLLYIGSDGKLRGEYWDGSAAPVTTSTAVTDGRWHYVVLSATSSSQTLYLDGAQVGTKSGAPSFTGYALSNHTQFGGGFLSSSWPAGVGSPRATFLKGSMGEIALYRTALSAAAVQTQYAAATQSDAPNAAIAATVGDPGGKTLSYAYDLYHGNRTLSETDGLGNSTKYGYDVGGFLYTVTDPNGNVTTTGHDVRGNVVSQKTCQDFQAAQCSTVYFTYYPDDTTASPPPDPRNDLITSMRDGRSASSTDNTFATTYEYDTAGNQTKVTTPPVPGFASGRATVTTYTTASTASSDGGVTPAGLVASITTPAGRVTSIAYAKTGDLTAKTDPSGLKTTFAYDALGRVTTKTEISDTYPSGLATSYTYDAMGEVSQEKSPASTNPITGVVHTPVTTTAYDVNGNPVSQAVSDPTGGDPTRITTSTYDNFDRVASTTDPTGSKITYGYDAYGNRASETDAANNVTAYAFDADGRLLTTTLKAYTGNPVNPSPAQDIVLSSRAYDPAGRVASISDAMGRATTYSYTDNGLLATVTRTDGTSTFTVRKVLHDAAGNIVQDTTNNGATVTTTTVDAAGRPQRTVLDAGGLNRTTTLEYDGDDEVTKQTVSDGGANYRATTYTYDGTGAVLTQALTGSVDTTKTLTSTYARDSRGLVTAATDPGGNTTNYVNDESGQVTSIVSPQVQTETNGQSPVTVRPTATMGYDTFGDQTQAKDANGNIKVTDFDAAGHVVGESAPSYTPPGSATSISPHSTTQYDAMGQVVATTDAAGAKTTYVYDQLGDLTQQTNPDGGVTTWMYDLNGEKTSATDPTGAVQSATYDFMGRRATSTDQVRQPSLRNLTTSYHYGTNGWLSSTTLPAGAGFAQTYDAAGEPVTVTDTANDTTAYRYDYAGRVTSKTNPDQTATTTRYDDAGHVLSQSDLDSTGATLRTSTASYDPLGQVVASTDPRGGGASYTYDATGRILSESQKTNATSSISTSFGYDAAGNRTRFTDGRGNIFLTTYNSWNLPESQIEPATTAYPAAANRTFITAYDANAQITSTTAPGNVTVSNSYDVMGGLTGSTGSGAEAGTTARSFGYDKSGKLTSASAPGGSNTFTYDDRGALLSASGPSGNSSFTYTNDNLMASRTDAAGQTNYTYDSADRLSTMSDPATGQTVSYAYGSMSLVSKLTYGNGNTRSFGYDALHRLASDTMTTSSGAKVASIAYGYDTTDNLVSKTTSGLAGPTSNTYTYDVANRLTSWNNGSVSTGYAYDGSGNRTQVGSATYTYDARNQLLSDGSKTYAYSARGTLASTTAGSSTTYTQFDAFNEAVAQGSTNTAYDALGRQVSSTNAQSTVTFSYTGQGNTIASDGTSTYSRDPSDALVAVGKGSSGTAAPYFAWTDQHTDLVGQFGAASTAVDKSVAYDPLGNRTTSPALVGALGYQSGWTDPASGRVNMLSRWYDPTVGQFISRDNTALSPIPNSASANKFAYVNDNPMAGTDPTGQCSWYDVGCQASAAVSYASSAWNSVSSYASNAWNTTSRAVRDDLSGGYRAARAAVTHVYHTAVAAVHKVVHAAQHYARVATHYISDGYHYVKHHVQQTYHAISRGVTRTYQAVKHYTAVAFHAVSTAAQTIGHAAASVRHVAGRALASAGSWVAHRASQARQSVVRAASASVQFLKRHAATITSGIVGIAVFAGCEAAVTFVTAGTLSAPGAIGCSALAGAAGNVAGALVTAAQSGRSVSAGELGSAALSGAEWGAIGGFAGPLLGKAVSVVGAKLAAPLMRALGRDAGEAASSVGDGVAAACGHSFTRRTGVVLATGVVVAIATLHVGDHVKTVDIATGKVRTQAVTRVMTNHDADLLDITVSNGRSTSVVHTTANHPIWSTTRHAWVRADQLTTTDQLRSVKAGPVVRVASLQATPGAQTRWDLTVAHDHNYFITTTAGTILVHNNSCSIAGNGAGGDASAVTKTFQTYTKVHPDTGEVYVGRTSGTGSPLENLARRDAGHAYNDEGFGPAQLDQSSGSYASIRGREQQLIEHYRDLGVSANKINGISPLNQNRDLYLGSAVDEFGLLK